LVFRTAYRITGSASDAEDVVQTIFLRLAQRDSLDVLPSSMESYLRRAAVNASIDLLRERRTARAVSLTESAGSFETGSIELKECLRTALASLNARSAEVFALRYFEDYSNAQIAAALKLSQLAVGVILHRTRRQLQNEIRSYMRSSK
jgi:RNA polymerase sigma-70 factor, ECF subfamily